MKKTKKKKKLKKIVKVILTIFLLCVISYGAYKFVESEYGDVKQVEFTGNTNLSIDDVGMIKTLLIGKEWLLLDVNKNELDIMENTKFARNVKLTRQDFGVVRVEIEEVKLVAYQIVNGKTFAIAENGNSIDVSVAISRVVEQLPLLVDVKSDRVVDVARFLSEIDHSILIYISELSYNELSEEVEMVMADGNKVFVDLSNHESVDYYFTMKSSFKYEVNCLYVDYSTGNAWAVDCTPEVEEIIVTEVEEDEESED